ncbi:YfbM family protein [Kovacikia minuta CCNUW1]|uniref:DUF1877 family protein n=1 Tax=Kovacikia minuta TaxID=2931930 RepID=UPI001CC8F694|nr:DUF1877 family protein [Kovacikia minuta]UBF23852.1 YfbM family protein [Kovacikia minuta CCNUW1]
MVSRGIHFALTNSQTEAVLAAQNDAELMSVIEEVEEEWNEEYLAQSDKAWNAIHRCLTDGSLLYESGQYPLNHCICGGRQLYNGEDYTVSFVSAVQVKDVVAALSQINQHWMQERYFTLPQNDYGILCNDDFQYIWKWFQEVRQLYKKASIKGRAVIFTVDC